MLNGNYQNINIYHPKADGADRIKREEITLVEPEVKKTFVEKFKV